MQVPVDRNFVQSRLWVDGGCSRLWGEAGQSGLRPLDDQSIEGWEPMSAGRRCVSHTEPSVEYRLSTMYAASLFRRRTSAGSLLSNKFKSRRPELTRSITSEQVQRELARNSTFPRQSAGALNLQHGLSELARA